MATLAEMSPSFILQHEPSQEGGDILVTREVPRMQGTDYRPSIQRLLVWALAWSTMLMAGAVFAEQYVVGDEIESFTLDDQHGESHVVDASVKVILFSRDMDGGDFLKEGLADVAPDYLSEKNAVYVADISGMPRVIARMFALPAMRRRPYSMLLDRDGETTAALPDVEGQATLIFLDRLTIERIVQVAEPAAVQRELEVNPVPGEIESP